MIRNALIVDVETNGLDPATNQVVEYGAVIYSLEHHTTIAQVSWIARASGNECEHINRIPTAAVQTSNYEIADPAKALFKAMVSQADVFIAHNAEFDRQWFPDFGNPWLCTMEDFKWPQATRERSSLVNLVLEHGIGVSSAHRALTDCQMIAALFDRMDDLQGMFAVAMRPKALFRALVSYDDRELAKAAGFGWDG